jgi:peptide/nickel transport system substrate-binding protein
MTPASFVRRQSRRQALWTLARGGLGLASLTLAAACAPAAPPAAPAQTGPATAGSGAAGAPRRGGSLLAAEDDPPTSLEPHKTSAWQSLVAFDHFYSSLTRFGANGEVLPDLAERWDVSPDRSTYTFQLRPNVKFHNGRTLTSEDVKYSIERVLAKETAAPFRSYFEAVTKIETPDPATVRFTLGYPFGPFLAMFAIKRSSAIVPREVVDKEGDLSNVAVGTGPWKLREWVPNERMVVDRFGDYYEPGLPYFDSIQYKVLPELASRIAALRAKQIDYALISFEGAEQIKGEQNLTVLSRPRGWVRVGLINHARKPLDDVRVRRALDLALDRNEIIQKGIGKADLSGPIPAGHPSYALKPEELPAHYSKPDLDGARQLLAQAGQANGFKIRLQVEGGHPYNERLCQVMQQNWKKIGVDAEIIVYPAGSITKAIGKESGFDFDVRFTAWTYYPDADNYVYNWYHSKSPGMDSLSPRWNDPDLDKLLEQGRITPDGPERRAIYVDVQKRLMETVPTFWFHNEYNFEAIQKSVKGFEQYPPARRALSLRAAWLDRG